MSKYNKILKLAELFYSTASEELSRLIEEQQNQALNKVKSWNSEGEQIEISQDVYDKARDKAFEWFKRNAYMKYNPEKLSIKSVKELRQWNDNLLYSVTGELYGDHFEYVYTFSEGRGLGARPGDVNIYTIKGPGLSTIEDEEDELKISYDLVFFIQAFRSSIVQHFGDEKYGIT